MIKIFLGSIIISVIVITPILLIFSILKKYYKKKAWKKGLFIWTMISLPIIFLSIIGVKTLSEGYTPGNSPLYLTIFLMLTILLIIIIGSFAVYNLSKKRKKNKIVGITLILADLIILLGSFGTTIIMIIASYNY